MLPGKSQSIDKKGLQPCMHVCTVVKTSKSPKHALPITHVSHENWLPLNARVTDK